MPASAQARWPDPRLQRLPIRLPRFPNETVRCYVRRLEAANHLPFGTLDNHLRDPAKQSGPLRPQRLAAISGWPLGKLQYALPELSGGHPIGLAGTRHGALHGLDPIPRRACRRCLASRGITGEATCWVLPNANVCLRHQRWIGPTNQDDADQFNLASLPDVVAAARRYPRLASRLGDRRVESTYHIALHITLRWAEREDFGQHRNRRLRILGHDPDRAWLASHHPAVRAAVYPDTVTLTGLLASPHWLRTAASLNHADHQRFYVEAARRLDLPDYQPCTGWDPLARWIDRHAPQQFREEQRRCRANESAGQVE
jgi:TniQ